MTSISSATLTVQRIVTADTLSTLLQSFDGLSNNPASLYLSSTAQNLVVYVAPKRTLSTISLPYLIDALRRKEEDASALKSLLENGPLIKVFFDARKIAKTLFDSCGIKLSNPVCFTHSDQRKLLRAACSLAPYERISTKCRCWSSRCARAMAAASGLRGLTSVSCGTQTLRLICMFQPACAEA
ncbi:hypothetical protein IG631_24007 [Alternaria alternata]|nr:hypothetical protein IG631_24341 [Alternaria alternata]KAH8621372.1 hypothetical protein IG631_24007 [Alternaria alternata]